MDGIGPVDPVMTPQALERRAEEYAGAEPRTDSLVSPLWGDFGGFPPLLIQVGSHEILLDDAVRLAGRAAASDVRTVLEVTAYVHHVFQAVAALLDEGDIALRRASAFLSQHLSGSPAGTARTAALMQHTGRSVDGSE